MGRFATMVLTTSVHEMIFARRGDSNSHQDYGGISDLLVKLRTFLNGGYPIYLDLLRS